MLSAALTALHRAKSRAERSAAALRVQAALSRGAAPADTTVCRILCDALLADKDNLAEDALHALCTLLERVPAEERKSVLLEFDLVSALLWTALAH